MSADRRTKQQIIDWAEAEIAAAKRQGEQAARKPAVPVADALAECVRALDSITPRDRGYGSMLRQASHDIRNIIHMLADRYHVDRIETVVKPCDRRHVEEMTTADVMEVIERGTQR